MNEKTVQTIICHPEDLSDAVLKKIHDSPNRTCKDSGMIYIGVGTSVFCCPDDPDGNEMMYELIRNSSNKRSLPDNASDIYMLTLKDSHFIPDQKTLTKYNIRQSVQRVAVVFRCFSGLGKDCYSLFSELIPLEPADVIIPSDYHTVILIKEMENRADIELIEYVDAIIGTMESEGISGVSAGIGLRADTIAELSKSYHEGLDALRVGMKYHRQEYIHSYSLLTLERIVDCIPAEEKKRIRKEYLTKNGLSVLNDEMLETVKSFFLNDLNLTAASKQLFIHRNTLNYRLDKIKRETGLDLRSFQEAVVFKIVSMICEENID